MIALTNSDNKILGVKQWYVEIVFLMLVCFTVLLALVPSVDAANNTSQNITANSSYAIVWEDNSTTPADITNSTNVSAPEPRRIAQGDCVYPGEVIDIAGTGWYSGIIVWYGQYYDSYGGAGNLSIEAFYKVKSSELDNFTVNKSFFSMHPGYWYNYDVLTDTMSGQNHGNDRLFKVSPSCVATPKENMTEMQEAINQSKIQAAIRANLTKMTVKTEPGVKFIVSKNSPISYDAPANSRVWIFGAKNDDRNYDLTIPEYNQFSFTQELLDRLPVGDYDMVFVLPGNNTIHEELYDNKTKALASPFRDVGDIDLAGLSPQMARGRLLARISQSKDDAAEVWKVAIQDPSIQVTQLSQTQLPGNFSYIVLSGYTNANQGEVMTITLDENTTNSITRPRTTWTSAAMNNGGGGAYRVWNSSAIIDFDGVFPGQHFITVTSESGGSATIPVYVRNEPEKHYQPEKYLKFVDNSPFIKPIYINTTITIPVPGPTRIVTQIVTPSQQQIRSEAEGVVAFWGTLLAILVFGLYVAIRLMKWIIDVYRRARL